MSLAFFIAKRLYSHRDDTRKVSVPAMRIATLGVATGLAIMIVSVCIVLGFKNEIRSKVIGFGSHIEVLNVYSFNSPESYPIVTDPPFINKIKAVKGIKHVQRYSNKTGILKTDNDFKGIMLKGIGEEYDMGFFEKHLVTGKVPSFSEIKSNNNILISQSIADALGLNVGDKIFAYFFEQSIKMRRFNVCGIYCTNMSQFDNNIVLTDIYTVNRLNNWESRQSSGLELTVNDYDKLNEIDLEVLRTIGGRIDEFGSKYSALTIQELYPQIFDWLNLLDLNVWIILALMSAVAGFTMISGLLILILERTNTIGLLKAMGATNATVRRVFLYFSVFIIGRGLILGNVIGLGFVLLQQHFGLIKLDPATYYVDSVPVLINVWLIFALNIGTLIVSILSLLGPSFLISRIQPAKAIRFD